MHDENRSFCLTDTLVSDLPGVCPPDRHLSEELGAYPPPKRQECCLNNAELKV